MEEEEVVVVVIGSWIKSWEGMCLMDWTLCDAGRANRKCRSGSYIQDVCDEKGVERRLVGTRIYLCCDAGFNGEQNTRDRRQVLTGSLLLRTNSTYSNRPCRSESGLLTLEPCSGSECVAVGELAYSEV